MSKKRDSIGTCFDRFLIDQGTLESTHRIAQERVAQYRLQRAIADGLASGDAGELSVAEIKRRARQLVESDTKD